MAENNTRERLILAGMEEIRAHGMQGFSLRRVSAACGVSCAAPYKHFEDKQALFGEMIAYVNEKWRERIKESFRLENTVEASIASLAAEYVAFLCENPDFKAILMIKETGLDSPLAVQAAGLSVPAKRLFTLYGRKKGLSRQELRNRIFIVRSLIYGSTIILGADPDMHEDGLSLLKNTLLDALK
jgi:AcrR family transcriptional regulator